MKRVCILFIFLVALCLSGKADNYASLPIGSHAPAFNLQGTDLQMYSLGSFANADILVVIFTCNHCPAAQACEERIKRLVTDYASKEVQVVAIMPNAAACTRLDELGYTEYGDSFGEMRIRAREKGYNFPYLYDGEKQSTAKNYGATATPQVFIFDRNRILQYSGCIDQVEAPTVISPTMYARDAIDSLLAGKPVRVPVTKIVGCSVRWDDNGEVVKEKYKEWANEPIALGNINEEAIKRLLINESCNLRLINIWSTWCPPCINELPDFVTINRMYRQRDFELVTICAGKLNQRAKALATLDRVQLSASNYIFNSDGINKLIDQAGLKWSGALPYTLLIEPGGKIIYAKEGGIQPMFLKKKIVEHPLIGRYF